VRCTPWVVLLSALFRIGFSAVHHKAATSGITNVVPVIIKAEDPQVSSDADLVFVCDMLHHVQDRSGWLEKAASEMKVGSRFALIEFKEGPLTGGPPEAARIPGAQLLKLSQEAGLRFESEQPGSVPYRVFLVFPKSGVSPAA
jgi:hypothetical protein